MNCVLVRQNADFDDRFRTANNYSFVSRLTNCLSDADSRYTPLDFRRYLYRLQANLHFLIGNIRQIQDVFNLIRICGHKSFEKKQEFTIVPN